MKRILKSVLPSALALQLYSIGLPATAQSEIPNNPDTSGWMSWQRPDDNIAMGSPIDASIVLDPPAGKHGFANTSGENFVFDNGVTARFWGINLSKDACFLGEQDAIKLANRIARSGFNIVRFHMIDYGPSPNVFSSVEPIGTKNLNAQQLNKLFYLMAQLKERGIYFYMDLLVMRPALASDGVINPEDLSQGWKAHSIFDSKLIELQKEYAHELLTTTNPYTGMALADDPALVFIDIHNENSLFVIDANRIRAPYYINQLKTKFSQWLNNKYTTDAVLQTAWAESGKAGLKAGESMTNNTVDIIGDGTGRIPNLYDALNYSNQRKNDSHEFFFDTVHAHYLDMRNYLRNEIGVKCMITGSSMGGHPSAGPPTLYLNKELMDYTDRHTYMSHPSSYYFGQGTTANNSSLVTGGNSFFRQVASRKVYKQPFVMGEWQECNTNDFRAEGSIMLAAMASFQNWNPLQFQMLAGPIPSGQPIIDNFFATYNDPAHTTTQPASAILFHRQDVKEATDVYYKAFAKSDALNPENSYDANKLFNDFSNHFNLYRYGKVGTMFSGLPDYNETDSSAAAYNKLNNKLANGETRLSDELVWEETTFTIDTPYTNAISGLQPSVEKNMGDAIINYTNPFAVISLNSITDETLQNTNKILLTAIGRSRNTGFILNGSAIQNAGQAPVLVELISGEIILKTGDNIMVYALDSSGTRTASIPVSTTVEGYRNFNISTQYNAVYYEILKDPALKRNKDIFTEPFIYAENTTAVELVSSGSWDGHVSASSDGAYSKVIGGKLLMQGRTTPSGNFSAPELRKNLSQEIVAGGNTLALNAKILTGTVGLTAISLYDNAGESYVANRMVTLQNGVASSSASGSATVAYTPGLGTAADEMGEYVNISIILDLRNKKYSTYVKGFPVIENATINNWNASNNLAIRLVGNYVRNIEAKNWGAFDEFTISPAFFKDRFDYNDNTTAAILVSSTAWDSQMSASSDGAYTKVAAGELVMQGRTTPEGTLSGPYLQKNLQQGIVAGSGRIRLSASIRTGTVGYTAISLYDNAGGTYVADRMVVLQNGIVRSNQTGSKTVSYSSSPGKAGDGTGEYVDVVLEIDFSQKRYSAYANGVLLIQNATISNWNSENNLGVRLLGIYSRDTSEKNWGVFDDFTINPSD